MDLFFTGKMDTGDTAIVSNVRLTHLLERAKRSVGEVIGGIKSGMPLDMVEID